MERVTTEALLEVTDLTLKFGGVTALNGVSFTVGRGELFAVIGPNGAGKTSIFNCLNGVYRPQQGTIKLDGVDLIGRRAGATARVHADLIVNATGFRPNLAMLREVRLDLDEVVEAPRRLAPLIDPNIHSCGTVAPHGFAELQQPESGFFIAGMKSYGRAPTFLLATGYEQVRSITAWLDGDLPAYDCSRFRPPPDARVAARR